MPSPLCHWQRAAPPTPLVALLLASLLACALLATGVAQAQGLAMPDARRPADVAQVVVRMIHACGEVDLAQSIASTPDVVAKGRAALRAGAPVLCDATMVAAGVTRRRLPA